MVSAHSCSSGALHCQLSTVRPSHPIQEKCALASLVLLKRNAVHSKRTNRATKERKLDCIRASSEDVVKSTAEVRTEEKAGVRAEEKSEPGLPPQQVSTPKKKRQADSTDFISSALTRRFGLAGGLAWLGVLSFGVISEQVKTRREVYEAEQNTKNVTTATEITLPDGVRYTDLVLGGGQTPLKGDLVLVNMTGVAQTREGASITFADTFAKGQRPVAFVFGGRPFAGALCRGVEEALSTTRAGGKRRILVPPGVGFGENDIELQNGTVVPGGSTLEYTVLLERVSIAPS